MSKALSYKGRARLQILVTVVNVPPGNLAAAMQQGLSVDRARWMLRKMSEIRRFEEKVEELFLVRGLLVGPSHLYLGQEAVATGICAALETSDLIVSTYRCHGHALAKGVSPELVMAELFGKATGTCKGLGGSMHASIYPTVGSIYATAIVGSGIPIAAGLAAGLKQQARPNVVACFFGDGAVNTGAFHEGLNLAALWRVPLVFVCENNYYAMSTHVERAMASSSIAERAAAYGVDTRIVDGNDVLAVYSAARGAVDACRASNGPVFLECRTYKHKGHGVYDKGEYRPRAEVETWLAQDPIALFSAQLQRAAVLSQQEFQEIDAEIRREIERTLQFATESPILPFEELNHYVFA